MIIRDQLDRPMRALRVSVTDRCNFRCKYCMPKEVFGRDYQFLARSELLSYEEIARLVRIFVDHGVEKVRITGGEPLVRQQLPRLIEMLAGIAGIRDLALTTNGVLLAGLAEELKAAGLHRVTVSLDSLDEAVFQEMNDVGAAVADVLKGIDAAVQAGLGPLKVNAVVKRGVNDKTVADLARHFHGSGQTVRFIEYMDVGSTNDWRSEHVVPAKEIVQLINAELPIEPLDRVDASEVARRWRYVDGGGEIGVISSVSEPFCTHCTRARLSAEGMLYTCLFASSGRDFRSLLRGGATDTEISNRVRSVWQQRTDRYSQIRFMSGAQRSKIEMSYIGG